MVSQGSIEARIVDFAKTFYPALGSLYKHMYLDVPTNWDTMKIQAVTDSLPFVGSLFSAYHSVRDSQNSFDDYMKNHPYAGFPKYPTKNELYGAYSRASGSALNFVSSNLSRLYR